MKCPATANGDPHGPDTSKTLDHVTIPRDKSAIMSMLLPKNGTDVRLAPALYYHRNSDPLLHRRSQSQMEEFGDVCLMAKARRRSEKDFTRNNCRSGNHKNCILNHSPTGLPQRRGSTPLCNGLIPTFKQNGILKGRMSPDGSGNQTMHIPMVNGFHNDIEDKDFDRTNFDPVVNMDCDRINFDGVSFKQCDSERTGNCDSIVCDENNQNSSLCDLDDISLEHAEHSKLRCEESLTIDIPELFQSSFIGETETEPKETEKPEISGLLLDVDDTKVKNLDISPRVLCNGTLITSTSDQNIAESETHPFILRDDSISGSESNCSVKHSVSWQKPRPLSSLSTGSGDNAGSLPDSLERHLTVTRNNSGSGSESTCSIKPVFSKKNPVSNFSSRSCSPQPGPSGYEVKCKRTGKKTVTYSDTIGDYKAAVSEENSNSATYQNSLVKLCLIFTFVCLL